MKASALLARILTSCAIALAVAFARQPAQPVAAGQAEQSADTPSQEVSPLARPMVTAATAFLQSLPPGLRKKAHLDYDDERRLVWHYYPRVSWERTGVMLKELDPEQQTLFRNVLRMLGFCQIRT